MSLTGIALFIHVVFAIALVGGSLWAHVAIAFAKRATTVEAVGANAVYLRAFSKAAGPIAAVVGIAGLYLTFDLDLWGAGWPVVSLVLFVLAGAGAGAVIDPSVTRINEAVEAAGSGPVRTELAAALRAPKLTIVAWLMAGADAAIVFLMTNKPGYAGAVATAVIGLVLGAAFGLRENRHASTASAPPAAGAPA